MGATCPVESSPSSPSLLQKGNLVFQAHHVGWIVASFFTIIAVITSFWLVNKHLQWYTNKKEQRYIVRLLFMVPIYATISLASYFFWNHATPLLLIRDGYESTVLTSFFYLLLTYLSPNAEDQRAIFLKVGLSRAVDAELVARGEEPKKWMFPLGFIKSKPADGLYFLQMMKWGVLQYCVIRPLTTLAAVVLNYIGIYCDGSFNPRWGYVYITAIVSVSVSIAMYCLIQLYMPVSQYLAPQKPLLKLFAIKAVVFLTFWQSTFLAALSMFGVVKDTTYMTSADINIGIAALLETFEMMLFAFLHLKAFSYKPYRPFYDPKSKSQPPTPTPRLRSLGHALDFRETFREIHAGWVYVIDKMKGREPTPDKGARRFAHYESAFGRPRPSNLPTGKALHDAPAQSELEKGLLQTEADRDISWLKLPADARREKSEDLEIQIERELERRGYGSYIPGRGHIGLAPDTRQAPTHKPQRSWWRSAYSRVSQSAPEAEDEERLTSKPSKRASRSRHTSRDIDADRRVFVEHALTFDDPPPPSVFASRRYHRATGSQRPIQEEHLDTLAPLSAFGAHRSSHHQDPAAQQDAEFTQPCFSVPTCGPILLYHPASRDTGFFR
ncbi:organic solute transporter Ostalpha-domain-containing protein [Mycena amicta]|nr:organic solute transporter Ostalpha-domain-containing protein [Mycena amicta]